MTASRQSIEVEPTMFTNLKIASVLVALVCVAVGCMTGSASAVTAQLAEKCQALTAKAFPRGCPVIQQQVAQKEQGVQNRTTSTDAWPMGATWMPRGGSERGERNKAATATITLDAKLNPVTDRV